jgi:predicted DNA-binding transcriptional regulator YafY
MPYSQSKEQLFRILKIVKRLYALEELKISQLALDYAVCTKTIRRDLQNIAKIIPLQKRKTIYSIESKQQTNSHNDFQFNLLSAFASNADVLLECFDKENLNEDKIAFAMEFNHLSKQLGEGVMKAIERGCKCQFLYKKSDSSSTRIVSPIKLYNSKERWYLIAKDDKDAKIKSFYFGKIYDFTALTDVSTTLTSSDIKEANEKQSIWSDSHNSEELVRVYVEPYIAEYILDGSLHKSQRIYDEHYDGGLEVHYTITHKMELLPQIKSYMPHIYVLEPKWLHDELMHDLDFYRDKDLKMDI